MNRLLDKLIVFMLCTVTYIQFEHGPYAVVPVILALAFSALASYLDRELSRALIFTVQCAASVFYPMYLFFVPLVIYDTLMIRRRLILLLAAVPLMLGIRSLPAAEWAFMLLFLALSWLLSWRTASLEEAKAEYIRLRDTTKAFSLELEGKNKELMEKQDYEVHLATLNERNRIARDIHDNIGHLLSNAILQTGALMATCQDGAEKERLSVLKDTLSQGMSTVRESIYNLYDESIDLYAEAKRLVDGFHFCEISMDYDVESSPQRQVKYAMLAVLKEALANIIKHFDATSVSVAFREHPALYQLTVRDNGKKKAQGSEGLGLRNIAQRVEALKGSVHIGRENGFTVFISIPKEAGT